MKRYYVNKSGITIEINAYEYLCEQHNCVEIGGAAMTDSNCERCGTRIINPSTNVDRICAECAVEFNVCLKCGEEL